MENDSQSPVMEPSKTIFALNEWRKILNARLLLFIAMLGALGVFGFTIADPTVSRQWAAAAYAITVLWPTIILFYRKG